MNSFSRITWQCQVERNDCHFVHLFKKKNRQMKTEKKECKVKCFIVTKQNGSLKLRLLDFLRMYLQTRKFTSIFTFQMNKFRFVRNYTRETTWMSTNWSIQSILCVCWNLSHWLCHCLCQFNLAYCLLSLFYYSSSQAEFVEFL